MAGHGAFRSPNAAALGFPWAQLDVVAPGAPRRTRAAAAATGCWTAHGTNATLYSCGTMDGDVQLASDSIYAFATCTEAQGGAPPPPPLAKGRGAGAGLHQKGRDLGGGTRGG